MRKAFCAALGFWLMAASGANAVSLHSSTRYKQGGTLLHKVHSLHEAKHSLRDLGYYDIEVERASLPYSFHACKRGVRYHIHVNYYGDLVQVDELGRCRGYDDDEYYRPRSRYPRYGY
jgi:hypothetical protein